MVSAQQTSSDDKDYYKFPKDIKSVAVIGGGPSGIPALRHLVDAGFDVRLFERQSAPGGTWTWSPESPLPTTFPTPPPSTGDFVPRRPPAGEDIIGISSTQPIVSVKQDEGRKERREFAPPNPVYWNLTNNVPTPAMAFKDFPWPENSDWYRSHEDIALYIRRYADHFNLNQYASYDTRVENVTKLKQEDAKWRLTLRKLESLGGDEIRETFWTEDFDAVVVASGHYGAPFIPALEGQNEWAQQWPESIIHSRAYRRPETYRDQTVLLVGTGTSGVDIGRDLDRHVKKIYQVTRDTVVGPEDYLQFREKQKALLPENGEIVPEIKRFLPPPPGVVISQGRIELTDGRVLSGIDAVIFSTGYQYSFPFLSEFHRDLGTAQTSEHQSPSSVLITNGAGIHNVYRDVFYIPDPTLTFLGLSINTPTFSFFEFQSIAITRVFQRHARLPGLEERKREYIDRLTERGGIKWVHLLGARHPEYVRETVEWLNDEAKHFGAQPVKGYNQTQLELGPKLQAGILKKYELGTEGANQYIRDLIAKEKEEGTPSLAPQVSVV
ncbi:hypothetical protein P7C73_g3316, partial [Tremellales sp. Uapishka_1]